LKSTPFHRVSFYVAFFSEVASPLNEDSLIDVALYEGLEKSQWLVQILWPRHPIEACCGCNLFGWIHPLRSTKRRVSFQTRLTQSSSARKGVSVVFESLTVCYLYRTYFSWEFLWL